MPDYTKVNFKRDVEDQAPKFGFAPNLESRFARVPLQLEKQGISYFKVAPGYRVPFGHRHETQEEVYVVVSGSARMKLDDEVVELHTWDAVRVPGEVMRSFEAGPEGAEIIAVGAPNTDNKDAEMAPNWWSD
jgi:mannose-6-phosphate isomerase-like protein (cupin superfamily)